MKPQLYSYIIADLLQRNSKLLVDSRKKEGLTTPWAVDTQKICRLEMRGCMLPSDVKRRIKAHTGGVWKWLRKQYIDTRQIYLMLLCWALTLTEDGNFKEATPEFKDLCLELMKVAEEGVDGETNENPEEITKAYEDMRVNYLPILHGMYENNFNNEE